MCAESKVYLLSYGMATWNDEDTDVGVFTDVDMLKVAYYELQHKKEQELKSEGWSHIDTIKIFEFQAVNRLIDDLEGKRRILPETLGITIDMKKK